MDNLARDAFLARQAGMSYGKWKATQPVVAIKKPTIEEADEKAFPCGFCGKMITDHNHRGRRYCDDRCANNARWKRDREKAAARRGKHEKEDGSANLSGAGGEV